MTVLVSGPALATAHDAGVSSCVANLLCLRGAFWLAVSIQSPSRQSSGLARHSGQVHVGRTPGWIGKGAGLEGGRGLRSTLSKEGNNFTS